MFIVVSGGSGSGKSACAEALATELEPGEKIYIATMEPFDEESRRRIARHRNMRAEKHFRTVECYSHLEEVPVEPGSTVLLECMSNLTANEMFAPHGRGQEAQPAGSRLAPYNQEGGVKDLAEVVLSGVSHLRETCRHLIIVTNNIFDDGDEMGEGSLQYMKLLGEVNRRMAGTADRRIEVVCGIPLDY